MVSRIVAVSLGLFYYPRGVWGGWPQRVRAEPEVLGLGLSLGLVVLVFWPQNSEGGRGRVRAAWLPPGAIAGRLAGIQGGNHASLPARLELFFAGGYGGAWSGAQAEERARRLAAGDRLRTRRARAGAGAEWNASGVPDKKKNMGFTLSWTVRAKRAPWVRCSVRRRRDSNLTSSLRTAAAGALAIRQMRPAGSAAGSYGIRKLPLHEA